MNVFGWPWHIILQWAGGLSAFVVLCIILYSIARENAKTRTGDDSIMMFLAVVAVSTLTLSTLLNFIIFVLF